MELLLQRREIYGTILYYPQNDLARQLAGFLKQKSFSKAQVDIIVKMGFKVTLKQEEI